MNVPYKNGLRVIVYDIEIEKAIRSEGHEAEPGIMYCDGWHDHANMGISVICAYNYVDDQYLVFCKDNIREFFELGKDSQLMVGFNNISFDDSVIKATYPQHGYAHSAPYAFTKRYDILRELWKAAGFGPEYNQSTHAGFGLDACAKANFGKSKTGSGADAPVLWQRGQIGTVINYCLHDVYLTKLLFDRIMRDGYLIDPRYSARTLVVSNPFV